MASKNSRRVQQLPPHRADNYGVYYTSYILRVTATPTIMGITPTIMGIITTRNNCEQMSRAAAYTALQRGGCVPICNVTVVFSTI